MSSSEAPQLLQLTAHAQDESTRIDILDGNLQIVPNSSRLGETTVQVPAGAYAVRFHIGSDYVERTAIITPQSSPVHVSLDDADAPHFATSAPVRQTRSTPESHLNPAQRISREPALDKCGGQKADGHLLVFTRDPYDSRRNDPAQGISLHELGGKEVCDFASDAQRSREERWAGCHYAVAPGAYRLRFFTRMSDFTEQIIYVVKGWQTQVFLVVSANDSSEGGRRANLESASVLMARPTQGFDPARQDLRWTESALQALSGAANIPGAARTEMLWNKFQNPMLGIYAGLLHLRRDGIDRQVLRTVFSNLMGLVGPLPDVLAIGWGLALRDRETRNDVLFMQALERPGDLSMPPLLRASWDLIVEASVSNQQIVPAGSFAERSSRRLTRAGPWYTWRGDPPPGVVAPIRDEPIRWLADSRLSKLIPAPLITAATHWTLGFILPVLAALLKGAPEAGRLLYTKRYTNTERRLAQYVYPLIDPQLQELVKDSDELTREARESFGSGNTNAIELVKSLRIPATVAIAAAWSLIRKMKLQPVVPSEPHLDSFVSSESRQNAVLKGALNSLRDESSPIHNKRGGDPVNTLAVVYLRYRGSPAGEHEGRVDSNETLRVLCEADYVYGKKDDDLVPAMLDKTVDSARRSLIEHLGQPVERGEIQFDTGWEELVLPAVDAYSHGSLLPPLRGTLDAPAVN